MLWLAVMSSRKATNCSLVWRAAVLPITSTVAVFSAAKQTERAVALVFKAVAFGASRRQWQHRILAVQRLYRGLLLDAKCRRMRRRVQIQPNHVGGLGFEVGFVGSYVGPSR